MTGCARSFRGCGRAERGIGDTRFLRVATAARLTTLAAVFAFPALSKLIADSPQRLDKWLWSVRLFKSRSLASDACRAGSVLVNEQTAKPARDVRPGETVTVKQGLILRTLRVVDVPRSRVGAKLVPNFCLDLTPKEELEKARERPTQQLLAREKGSGRPTKRDRRLLDQLLG
jgi:ribosome-associated heat shock protein Hsp15